MVKNQVSTPDAAINTNDASPARARKPLSAALQIRIASVSNPIGASNNVAGQLFHARQQHQATRGG